MAKKKQQPHKEHSTVVLSQRAKSRLAKQKQRQKVTRWISIGIVSVVAIILSVGLVTTWLLPVYLPLQKTVLTVNGKEFNAQYVARAVNYFTGGDPTYSYLYIDLIIEQIQQYELMKEAATELGITVTDAEVKGAVQEAGLPNNQTNRDIVYASILSKKLREGRFADQIGSSGPQRQALVMLLESAAQAEAVKARLEAGEVFSEITAELSLDSTTITEEGDMGLHPEGILNGLLNATGLEEAVFDAGEGDIGFFYDESKNKQLGYWLVKVTERKTENELLQAQAYGILLPTIEQAQEVRQKLLDGGDFAALAAEYSQDDASKDLGGDLGLLTLGATPRPYDTYVFNEDTPLDQLSEPILTKDSNTNGAYWLFKVENVEENATFADDDKTTLVNKAFTDWLLELKDDPSNDITVVELTEDQRTLIAEESLR